MAWGSESSIAVWEKCFHERYPYISRFTILWETARPVSPTSFTFISDWTVWELARRRRTGSMKESHPGGLLLMTFAPCVLCVWWISRETLHFEWRFLVLWLAVQIGHWEWKKAGIFQPHDLRIEEIKKYPSQVRLSSALYTQFQVSKETKFV